MQILTPTGYKDINDVNIGDELINYIDGKIIINHLEKKSRWTEETEGQGAFTFYLINNSFKLYKNQSIWANGKLVHTTDLKKGDVIYSDLDEELIVLSIEETTSNEWWRLTVSGDHSYIADGLSLHNASRFWVGGGSSTNWSATSNTNWSATSGGSNNATVPGSSDDVTFNGNGVNANGASVVSANITILSLTFTSGYTNTVTINTAVTLTIAGNFTDRPEHSWTVNGTGAMTISAASTITSNGKTFPGPVSFTNTNTKTLSGNWTISGVLTLTGNTTLNWTTNETLSCAGITCSTAAQTSGTAKIILTGGTWAGSSNTSIFINNNMDIAGNVTISGNVSWGSKTLTYVSGTVTTTNSALFMNTQTPTFNTDGITFNNLTWTSTTVTLNSLLTATGTMTLAGNCTFAGTSGFTVGTLTHTGTTAFTITLANTVTYTVTSSLTCITSRTGSILLFTSDDGTNKAILTLQNGGICNVLASFTRIDASFGRPILTFNGTITTCTNVFAYTDVQAQPSRNFKKFDRRMPIYNRAKTVQYF